MKVVQVCKENCQEKPFDASVKGYEHTFCCKKGFHQILKDFTEYLNNKGQNKYVKKFGN